MTRAVVAYLVLAGLMLAGTDVLAEGSPGVRRSEITRHVQRDGHGGNHRRGHLHRHRTDVILLAPDTSADGAEPALVAIAPVARVPPAAAGPPPSPPIVAESSYYWSRCEPNARTSPAAGPATFCLGGLRPTIPGRPGPSKTLTQFQRDETTCQRRASAEAATLPGVTTTQMPGPNGGGPGFPPTASIQGRYDLAYHECLVELGTGIAGPPAPGLPGIVPPLGPRNRG